MASCKNDFLCTLLPMGVGHSEEVVMHTWMFNCTKISYPELLEEKCSVALKIIVMFWLSRALLHTVIYFSFAGSCFTSVSQWCYGSSLFFVCPDWLGSKVSNYFSTFKPQVWFPQTGLVRDVPLKHKTFIRAWKMLSNKQGLVKSLG